MATENTTPPPAVAEALQRRKHCPDCGVEIGGEHKDGCDVARCLWTGRQRLSCDRQLDYSDEPEHDPRVQKPDDPHECGRDVWTGLWPGDADAIELDWWVYWDGPGPEKGWDYKGQGWVRTTRDDPRARPDLNRLAVEARWDRETKRWVAR